jgi:hypothetical protein
LSLRLLAPITSGYLATALSALAAAGYGHEVITSFGHDPCRLGRRRLGQAWAEVAFGSEDTSADPLQFRLAVGTPAWAHHNGGWRGRWMIPAHPDPRCCQAQPSPLTARLPNTTNSEAHLLAPLVTPAEAFVKVLAALTLHIAALEFCGTKATLLPCPTTTKLGPVAATLGLAVPNQSRRHVTSPKIAHRMNTLSLQHI